MQTLFSILTLVFSIATMIAATVDATGPFNPRPFTPWLLGAAIISLIVTVLFGRKGFQPTAPKSFDVDLRVNTVPSPAEIEEQIRRVQELVRRAREADGDLPQPDCEISVECFACHVTENYPAGTGNAAAQSAHLLTHPERCLVIGA